MLPFRRATHPIVSPTFLTHVREGAVHRVEEGSLADRDLGVNTAHDA